MMSMQMKQYEDDLISVRDQIFMFRDAKNFQNKRGKKVIDAVSSWKGSEDMNEIVKVLSIFLTTPTYVTSEAINNGLLQADGLTETEKGKTERLAKTQESNEMKEYNALLKKIKDDEKKQSQKMLQKQQEEQERREKEENKMLRQKMYNNL